MGIWIKEDAVYVEGQNLRETSCADTLILGWNCRKELPVHLWFPLRVEEINSTRNWLTFCPTVPSCFCLFKYTDVSGVFVCSHVCAMVSCGREYPQMSVLAFHLVWDRMSCWSVLNIAEELNQKLLDILLPPFPHLSTGVTDAWFTRSRDSNSGLQACTAMLYLLSHVSSLILYFSFLSFPFTLNAVFYGHSYLSLNTIFQKLFYIRASYVEWSVNTPHLLMTVHLGT